MVTTQQKLITPTFAGILLKKNTNNFRRINQNRVIRYATDMSRGNWIYCADPIRIADDDTLLDGQHRLHAIINANVSILCLVVSGLPKEAAIAMDKGQARTAASWVSHSGVKNAKSVSSISRLCKMYQKGMWHYVSWGSDCITDNELIEFALEKNDTIQSSLRLARVAESKVYLTSTLIAAIMHEAAWPRAAEDVEDCVWFCNRLNDGVNIAGNDLFYTPTSAVYHLRERFIAAKGGKTHAAHKENPYMCRALATSAWNKTVQRQSVKQLRYRPEVDDFPSFIAVPL